MNDRADVALAAGADVLHLGQDDLPVPWARRIVGDDVVIGRSTHSADGDARRRPRSRASTTSASARAGRRRPSPAAPPRGWTWCARSPPARPTRPWFAIGGIDHERLDEVLAAGAERIVVVRAITEAEDPRAAAAALKARLPT